MAHEIIELISFKVTAIGARPRLAIRPGPVSRSGHGERLSPVFFRDHGFVPTRFLHRERLPVGERLAGPLVVVEGGATTLVAPGMGLEVNAEGLLLLDTGAAPGPAR
jgi:N-methylhydantoinase A/oxoprolinase/acetone carboxylase beta subunit